MSHIISHYLSGLVAIVLFNSSIAADLHAYTEDVPPLNYLQQGQLQGYSVELLQIIAHNAGINIDIEVLPWARAVATADTDPNSILFTVARTPAREKQYQWLGPISKRRIVLIKLASRGNIQAKTVEDTKKYTVGAVRESASAKKLQQLGFIPDKSLDLAPNDTISFKKLIKQRNDIIAILDWSAAWQAREQGLKYTQLSILAVLDEDLDYYFALSNKINPLQFARLKAALAQAEKMGKLEQLRHKYFN
ncbi:MAG: hypothetical protein RL571_258 [Pseudomonadota bacterium]